MIKYTSCLNYEGTNGHSEPLPPADARIGTSPANVSSKSGYGMD